MKKTSSQKSTTKSGESVLPSQVNMNTYPKVGIYEYYCQDPTGALDPDGPFLKYNDKGEIIQQRGTPFQIMEMKKKLKEEGQFPFEKKKRKYNFKISPDQQAKSSHTRRNRGRAFEDWVVKEMRKRGYEARKLGGASTKLPDIAATIHRLPSKKYSSAIMFECKAKKDVSTIWVPYDEVLRCENMQDMFKAFFWRTTVLAFKFPEIRKPDGTLKRKLQYRFVEIMGFDIELEDLIKEIGYNLTKEELVFHWGDIENVGYPNRGEDYDWTMYPTLDLLLTHLGQFHTQNADRFLAQIN